MIIRYALTEDLPQLLDLLRQVGRVHHQGRPDLFRPDAQKYDWTALEAVLRDPDRPVFVAVEGTRVLGYGFAIRKTWRGDPVLADRTTLYLDDLCVDRSCRRQGVGRRLYAYLKAYARETGCQSITLNVWACNEEARKFYDAMGLQPQKIGLEDCLEEP